MEYNGTNFAERLLRAEEVIGGNSEALEQLRHYIIAPHLSQLYYPRTIRQRVKWPRGVLLHGPPGTGKTSLVRAVVRENGAHLTVISSYSVCSAEESERKLREDFASASSHASLGKPSVIFIDEIDRICPRPSSSSASQQSIHVASQLIMLMESIKPYFATSIPQVVVVAATNRVYEIDPALRRYGRLEVEIEVKVPTVTECFDILKLYTKKLRLDPGVDLQAIAAYCNGYVGADLMDLCRKAYNSARGKLSAEDQEAGVCSLTMVDWNYAMSVVHPSITKGIGVETTYVSWDDIGGYKDLKKELQKVVEWPIKHSAAFSRFRIPCRGILLHGPPGCSKTILVKAAANASKAKLFTLSPADFFNKYVGEGEALLRNTFRIARHAAPSIIFIDEVETIATRRSFSVKSRVKYFSSRNNCKRSSEDSSRVGGRLLATLLTEMDGLEQHEGITVIAATNRADKIDPALRRPKRFDKVLYVPPPDLEGRYEILRLHTRNMKVAPDIDFRQLAEDTELFTGADLANLCYEAGIVALKEYFINNAGTVGFREEFSTPIVCSRHFRCARNSLKPSLTKEQIASYSSCLEKPSLRAKLESKCKTYYLVSKGPVTVGVFGFILLAGFKYFLIRGKNN